jgi:methionine--tRNA ligase beta chain
MTVDVKAPISFEDLEKIDIRAGTIVRVSDVPRSDKVVQLTVDFGSFTRSILCGIKQERSDLQALVGRQTLFVVNLPPKKISGVVSEGMLFDIGYADGVIPSAMAMPEFVVPNGVRAG